jgi:hypothetical protein
MADYASETTLQELLNEAKAMNASLLKLSAVLGKSGAPSGAAGAANASKSINDMSAGMSKVIPQLGKAGAAFTVLTVAVEAAGKVFNMLGSMISGLFSKIGNVASILGEFAVNVSKGNMKVSDLVGVMGELAKQVPLVGGALGMLFDIFKLSVVRQEENLEVYRTISSVGAGVGSSLTELRGFINSTGLNMDEFARVVAKNGDTLSMGLGSTDAGMRVFGKGMRELNDVNSDAGKIMRGLGLNGEQMADSMMLFMRTQGSVGKSGLQDSKVMAAGAAELASQLTQLSEITGKQRATIEAELKAATEEANFQAFLAGLDPEEAKRATAGVADAMAKFGKDGAEQAKFAIRTGITTPINEAGMRIALTTQGASDEYFANMNKYVRTKDMSDAQYLKQQDGANWKMIQNTRATGESLGDIAQLAASQGKQITSAEATAYANRFKEAKNFEEYQKIMVELRGKEAKAKDGEAADIAGRQQQLKNFGKKIDDLISSLLAPLIGPVMKLIDSFLVGGDDFIEKIKPFTDILVKIGTQLVGWISETIGRFAKIKNVDEFWAEVKNTLSKVWTWMKPVILEMWNNIKPVLLDGLSSLFGALFKALMHKITFGIFEGEASSKESGGSVEGVSQTGEVDLSGGVGETPETPLGTNNAKAAKVGADGQPVTSNGTDNFKAASDLAYRIMTQQATDRDVPANLKDQVNSLKNDTGLKQQAEKFKADAAKKREDEQRQQQAADAKKTEKSSTPDATPSAPSAPAASTSQDSKPSDAVLLNNSIERLIRINTRTAEAAEDTVKAINGVGGSFGPRR